MNQTEKSKKNVRAAEQGTVVQTLLTISDRTEKVAQALVVISEQLTQAVADSRTEIKKIKVETPEAE